MADVRSGPPLNAHNPWFGAMAGSDTLPAAGQLCASTGASQQTMWHCYLPNDDVWAGFAAGLQAARFAYLGGGVLMNPAQM